jgi:hypothetical protein
MARDPLLKALRGIKRDANRDIQLGRDNDGDEANQRWHLADDGLRAARPRRCPSWVCGQGRKS